ncbi:hypothetical protein LTR91_007578 [Friedmanniomyces endolithicus]|uniref:Uncharacterized protein n=1 Tax=Friedmanniomyces endolithicus TaxID=329885 RepID=A0AAN6QW23_9PEZI|nr:hypothetical protein LTR03_003708 [Friedmanniomyces endolithicus]KAK0869801.1 hypothetical protein LTS02_002847 [Friedmanniomyces endolithicus]KAK0882026.1 hypothetical protein LTR87_004195 [Friedmanniomyces endolithicus]KAK0915082.1 hypothetical protein LTR02_001433 [Friedmanniomyces endolithicus]KAK0922152.1 hypothetical protein LTR57_008070 [Friedmanniomyces endolithicus]
MDTKFFFVPASGLQAVANFLAAKPLGCGDDAAEFHASFTNWAIALALKPVDALTPSQLTIRDILRSGVPETNAGEYNRALELYGREFRYHYVFKSGEIKDPKDPEQYLTARKKLYSLLFTKHEQKTLLARYPRAYPLKVPKGWDGFVPLLPDPDRVPPPPIQYEYHKKTDFEFAAMAHGIAAQWGDDAAGMALRTKPGEDSDMAESIEGLGLSRQRGGEEEEE